MLLSLASLSCFAGVVLLNHLATLRAFGKYEYPQVSGYFIGRCLGAYILPALGVFLYYKIRRKSRGGAEQFLVISGWALFWSLLAFAGTPRRFSNTLGLPIPPNEARTSAAAPKRTVAPTKWDPAIRSYYGDLRSFNEQYLAEVSKLDSTALPLYTAESFSDSARIQQTISQLQGRLEVAKRFAAPEKLLSKMPEYVSAIDASDSEKQVFLKGFNDSARKDLAQRKTVNENEQSWIQSSIALYRLALSQQGAYSIQAGQVVFKRKSVGSDFDRKVEVAQLRRFEFLRSFGRYIAMQNNYMAQFGLPPMDIGGSPQSASSISRFLSSATSKADSKTNQR